MIWWRKKRVVGAGPIAVLPKNYRRISIKAIELATDPHVYMDKKEISDYSTDGKLTQKGIRPCIDFLITDGSTPILGFHDHPNEMWISEQYSELAKDCCKKGWLKIQTPSYM